MNKFTFKMHERSGRYRAFDLQSCDIKLNGKVVGSISEIRSIGPPGPDERKFRIGFCVRKKDIMEDKNPNCEWMWKFLQYKPLTIQEAKDFLSKFSTDIQTKFDLYLIER